MRIIAFRFVLRFLESGHSFALSGTLDGMRRVFDCGLEPVFWFVCHINPFNHQRRVPWLSMRLWCYCPWEISIIPATRSAGGGVATE